MKCPNCLSVLYNSTEVVDLEHSKRMDLHCHNKDCPSIKVNYKAHVGVLIYPYQPWICYNYNLPFQYNDNWYALEGHSQLFSISTRIYKLAKDQIGWTPITGGGAFNNKALLLIKAPVVDVEFIPISTGDDMHLEANKLFNRLMGLILYT